MSDSSPYETREFTRHGHKFIARFYVDSDTGAPWDEHDGHGPVSDWKPRESKRPGQRPIGDSDHGSTRFYDWQEATKLAKRDGWGWLPGKLETRQINATTWQATCPGFVALGDDINKAIANLYAAHRASMTPGQYIAGAVQKDYDHLDGWARNQWHWCGVSVAPMRPSYERLREAVEAAIDVEIDDDARDTLEAVLDDLQRALDADDEYAPEDFANALWGIESIADEYLMETAIELADQIIAELE